MSGNIRKITSDDIIDTPSQRHEESGISLSRGDNSNYQTPASREEWAEVLATADRYY